MKWIIENWFLISGVLFFTWIACCIKKIRHNEMGVKVFWGKPKTMKQDPNKAKVCDSGLCWIWFPLEVVVRYTKEVMKFKFRVKSIMTKKGKIKGYDDPIEPAEIDITSTIYARFDKNNLLQTIRKAPGSTAEELGPFLIPYVMDIVRALGGRLPWRLINQARHNFAQCVLGRLIPEIYSPMILPESGEEEKDSVYEFNTERCDKALALSDLEGKSPFVQFGLTDVAFTVEDIDFIDKELKKAISAPEKARLEADAKRREAEGERDKLTEVGKGSADAREMMINVIKEQPDLEVLLSLREMAQGTSNTILYQLPSAFEDRIKNMLGGQNIGEMLRILKPDAQKTVLKAIENALKKLEKSK
ncbi:SPFH domain-containing protein [Candidatus Parcubacteria bacterium]|nr:SPFH domain-containing protein [Candidatus Parcubacteria bacterium]